MVLGLPMGRIVGQYFGWRTTFFAIGLGALDLLGASFGIEPQAGRLAHRLRQRVPIGTDARARFGGSGLGTGCRSARFIGNQFERPVLLFKVLELLLARQHTVLLGIHGIELHTESTHHMTAAQHKLAAQGQTRPITHGIGA